MPEDTARIKLRIGDLELEYEGSRDFLKSDLLSLLQSLSALEVKQTPKQGNAAPTPLMKPLSEDLSTSTIASKLGVATGPDLILAAAACLQFSQGRATYTDKEIHSEMKKAVGRYKVSYGSNLQAYVKALVAKDKLRITSSGQYTLPDHTISELQSKIGG